jgi:multiple sugar transport system permease protein
MPIISPIGARSWKVRLVYGLLYAVLAVGAATMVYPFTLMLSGSLKSEADVNIVSPWPRFWTDDLLLFQKYVESKHNVVVSETEAAWGRRVGSWRSIVPPSQAESGYLEEFLQWRPRCPWWTLGHTSGGRLLPINARLFRGEMAARFHGDIDAYRRAMRLPVGNWNAVMPPMAAPGRYPSAPDPLRRAMAEFAAARPVEDRIMENIDGQYWQFLVRRYSDDINVYNREHGTRLASYDEVFLDRRAPDLPRQRADWEEYVREILPLRFIRLDPGLAGAFREHLAEKVYAGIGELNARYGTSYAVFSEVQFPTAVPRTAQEAIDWGAFVRERERCPVEKIEVFGPRQLFEAFVAQRRGAAQESVGPIRLPIAAADYHDCMARKAELRWEFTSRNYKHVLEYILLHGRGILNTVVYCVLAVGAALLVNPLAAYAMSRFRLPGTYKVLLFCMATMAFPGAVTMIPAFLLMKRFPLGPILGGAAAFILAFWLMTKWRPAWREGLRLVLALAAGLAVGAWAVPTLTGRPYVSLLNTFAALVLPGAANGFFIFLLKGFFDSLPRELYEAADIDGAGEWTKFWTLTMNLSKPILAVIALGAFTGAYSAFMMALIIIPDTQMWTLMVWIFQLQTQSHAGVVYAALVLAAIPTFIVFVLCQNIIIRGIVLPVEK